LLTPMANLQSLSKGEEETKDSLIVQNNLQVLSKLLETPKGELPILVRELSDDSGDDVKRRSRNKSSNFRGVSKCAKDGRWQARIRIGRSVKYLGRYKTEEDAARCYDVAAVKFHGDRAVLNFPDEKQLDGLKAMTPLHLKSPEFDLLKLNKMPPKKKQRRASTMENGQGSAFAATPRRNSVPVMPSNNPMMEMSSIEFLAQYQALQQQTLQHYLRTTSGPDLLTYLNAGRPTAPSNMFMMPWNMPATNMLNPLAVSPPKENDTAGAISGLISLTKSPSQLNMN